MSNKTYYYVVKKGIVPGIYKTWTDCKEQIHEFPGAIYKKFDNMPDAVKFLHSSNNNNQITKITEKDNEKKTYKKFNNTNDNEIKQKSVLDYFDQYSNIDIDEKIKIVDDISVSRKAQIKNIKNTIYIFCDGSAIHDKQHQSIRCGFGLFILIPLENDSECIMFGEELISTGTNNLAELNAILHGLKYLKDEYIKQENNLIRNVIFVSDSKYAINCILVWSESWKKNNWQTVNKKSVENKELIQEILIILEEINNLGFTITFKHINSHQVKPENDANNINKSLEYLFWFGNEMADQLARIGHIKKKYDSPKILIN